MNERTGELQRLRANIGSIEQIKLAASEERFADIFHYKLAKLPLLTQFEKEGLFKFDMSNTSIGNVKKCAAALVFTASTGTSELWIEQYNKIRHNKDWLHVDAERNLNRIAGTNSPHWAESAFILVGEDDKTHLVTDKKPGQRIANDIERYPEKALSFVERYSLSSVSVGVSYSTQDKNYLKYVQFPVLERDLFGEINKTRSVDKFYIMYEMSDAQIQEFNRRLKIAQALDAAISFHQIAFEATGKNISEY